MNYRSLSKCWWGVVALMLAGCDVAQSARSDFAKITRSVSNSSQTQPTRTAPQPKAANPRAVATVQDPHKKDTVRESSGDVATATVVDLRGKSEAEVRSLLGPPNSEEDRAPGKTWHYRDGQCLVDVQLYPDVQTRQFGTLSYEVKSDDGTDEGKHLCMAQLQSRARGIAQ
jgi:hypothetical protein